MGPPNTRGKPAIGPVPRKNVRRFPFLARGAYVLIHVENAARSKSASDQAEKLRKAVEVMQRRMEEHRVPTACRSQTASSITDFVVDAIGPAAFCRTPSGFAHGLGALIDADDGARE